MEYGQKITVMQLKRKAALYLRQSTMKQVFENSESTIRQYGLKEKLIQLGWQPEDIIVIDCDLGQSGSGSSERSGFKKLVADVSNDEVGAIACLETSRLARNSQEWNRLMEICSITKTVLIDADGIYDLNDFNDRMLLGFKGTMSEAELHFIRSRMIDGALSKAKRGELKQGLPVGYVYDEANRVIKAPNIEVQASVKMFFEVFRMCGSATGMASYYNKNGYKIPSDPSRGFNCKEIIWGKLSSTRALNMLRNPVYAGVYAFGQRQVVRTIDGNKTQKKPDEEWHVRIPEHHEAYISEDVFILNQHKLFMNNTNKSPNPPVREGSALLQGICLCGKCGLKMSVVYHVRNKENVPNYICNAQVRHNGEWLCQHVHGSAVDKAISDLVLEKLTPVAISKAIQIEEEVRQRETNSGNYFVLQLERARYEVNLARKRYMNVDPSNRLVAHELESIWNQKIAALAKAEEELRIHENAKQKNSPGIKISELMSIPGNITEVWNSSAVSVKDKKRIIRCLIEDVTITKIDQTIRIGVRFKTGSTTVIECPNPPKAYMTWTTPDKVVDIVRRESLSHSNVEIAAILNREGCLSGKGSTISVDIVNYIMREYSIPSFQDHLKTNGFLTSSEKAAQLNISVSTLHKWKYTGKLDCNYVKTSGSGDYMFEP
jgi:DNA invertase Pin-like site-specific DNA recombinase